MSSSRGALTLPMRQRYIASGRQTRATARLHRGGPDPHYGAGMPELPGRDSAPGRYGGYGADLLNPDWRPPRRGRAVEIEADKGLVVEEVPTDWCGEIVAVERDLMTVTLEDRRRRRRTFPLGPGFLLEGVPVILTAPARKGPAAPTRTASGSVAVPGTKARVARASRIFVEGRHDAELVEKVWGDDLRVEGVVVEYLDGVDDLSEQLRDFRPGPERRVGVLVDHLVAGSKESRIAASIARSPVGRDVLVVGHPFVDIWAAVKPARFGIEAWPRIPRD